ncbi:MAG: hypothetical protein IVW54_11030 [Candidatus Binataceae bacterium]|nr:hypothetical protein [Candidatus Binataceae bacterium]
MIGHLQKQAYLSFLPALGAQEGMLELRRAFFDVTLHCVELARISEGGEALARLSERFEASVRSKAEELGSLGWTIPLDASLYDTIRLLERSTSAETSDAAFAAFYEADGGAAYLSLKDDLLSQAEMEPWREDLTAACARLADDDYRSCVNNLLPVVDGFGAAKLSETRFQQEVARSFLRAEVRRPGIIVRPGALALGQGVRRSSV